MFGMGFGEILLVAIVAIVFLGPEKLPETMVNIAKFFKSIKTNITQAKIALESELDIAEMKKEAIEYKEKIEKTTANLYEETTTDARDVKNIFSDLKNDTPKAAGDSEKKS
jgi:sec-independent protein translocase protein TatB